MTKTSGNFTDFVDFSRASSATYLGSDGLIQTASNNVPRVEYDASGNVKGLLIEEARTNLFAYSQPESAGFGEIRSSLVTSVLAAPDGNPAEKLVEDSTAASSHQLTTGAVGMSLNTTYTMSWFAKAAERDFIAMNIYSGTTSYWTWFDLSNGTVGTATNSPTTFIEDYGNGWYRCGITVTTAASGTPNTATYIAPSNGVLNYNGDGSSGIYVYGAQLEAGSFATSYIPTTGSTATRSLDLASIDIDNFGYNNQAASVLVEFSAYSWADRTDSTNFNRVWEFAGGGPASNADGIFRDPAASPSSKVRYRFNEDDGTTAALGADNLDVVTGTHKVCVALGQDDAAICMDGGTVKTGSGTAAMTLYTGIDFGGDNNQTALGGHIKSFQYYPRRLTNAQLQELTS